MRDIFGEIFRGSLAQRLANGLGDKSRPIFRYVIDLGCEIFRELNGNHTHRVTKGGGQFNSR